MEIMGRYMTELGMTPAARTRVAALNEDPRTEPLTVIRLVGMSRDDDGNLIEHDRARAAVGSPDGWGSSQHRGHRKNQTFQTRLRTSE